MNRRRRSLWGLLALIAGTATATEPPYVPREGDIIFQTSHSNQSLAIQRATHSRYSHMGLIEIRDGQAYVLEAIGPVQSTPLARWVARGVDGHYVVKRLRDARTRLDEAALERLRKAGAPFKGRPYDLHFDWSDDKIYCSELVWKVYKRALDVEIGRLQAFRQFDLSDPLVRRIIAERYGETPPLDERVISPAAMFASQLLTTVYAN